jgi:pimeloyl-ACP methyl ester carboxylesterase
MAEIQVQDRLVFYTTGGKAWEAGRPLLVFVHGSGGTQTVWISQSRALAHHGWNVAAVDLPGHGYSEDVPGLSSIEEHAEWLGAFLAALGQGPAVLVGHSMGAGVALTCAATRPEQVKALVLVGTRLEMKVSPALLESTRDDPARATRFITAYGHAPGSHLGGAPTPGSWMLGSAQSLLDGCDGTVLHRDFAASHAWNGSEYAAKVACPTLVITGAQDRMTPAVTGREMAGAIRGAEHVEIPATGHFMMIEAPRPVLKTMRAFLDRLLDEHS